MNERSNRRNDMATIREWLSESKFDWEKGTIIYQEV